MPTAITSSNQAKVAQVAVAEAGNAGMTAADAGVIAVGAQVQVDPVSSRNFSLAQNALKWAKVVLTHQSVAPVVAGVVVTDTQACPSGGSFTFSHNDINANGGVDAGETVSLSLNNCSYSGSTENGSMSLTINSYSGDLNAGTGTASLNITYSNYSFSSGGVTVLSNGGLVISATQLGTQDFKASLTLSNLYTQIVSGGSTLSSSTQSGTVSVLMANDINYVGTFNFNVFVSGTWNGEFGAASLVSTTPVHLTNVGDPFSGVIEVTGLNSKLRVTILNTTSASVQLDANNDGIYESTTIVAL